MKRLVVAASALLLVAACGSAAKQTHLTVDAAASLKEPFTALGTAFEARHPGTHVTFNFGGSPDLVAQVNQGAPVDVLATASTATMSVAEGIGASQVFATNTLEIAVPKSNTAHITALADLAKPGVKVALCQPKVPCGVVATKVLANAGVALTPVTQEADVKSVLTKVSLGEVDAGLVYVTDVKSASGVTGVEIPGAVNDITRYPIAEVNASKEGQLARAFIEFVLSADGRKALSDAGFGRP